MINNLFKMASLFYKISENLMSLEEAAALLEVSLNATKADVERAYHHKMAPFVIMGKKDPELVKQLILAKNLLLEISTGPSLSETYDLEERQRIIENVKSNKREKPSKQIPPGCNIFYLEDDRDAEKLKELNLDKDSIAGDVEDIFDQVGIHYGSEEEICFGAVCNDEDTVVPITTGGATLGVRNEDGENIYIFSVAIDENWQGMNLGRKLVEKVIEEVRRRGGFIVRAWVVNPNMAKLLENMGFDTEHNEWSQDSPHLTYYL